MMCSVNELSWHRFKDIMLKNNSLVAVIVRKAEGVSMECNTPLSMTYALQTTLYVMGGVIIWVE